MKELDLQPLVEIAIALGEEARQTERHEILLGALERDVAQATPCDLSRRIVRIAEQDTLTRYGLSIAPQMAERLRKRVDRGGDHPGVIDLVTRLLEQTLDLAGRNSRLRRRRSDLEMLIVGAVRDLQRQSVDARILRLYAEEGHEVTEKEIRDRVETDHAEIADALATWRLSNGPGMVFSIAETTTPGEVAAAMRRLERTGHARRSGRPFCAQRWTIAVPEEQRLSA